MAIELSDINLGTGGFVINGQCYRDFSGVSVASAGDVNGDGLADLIVGAHASDPAAGSGAGRSYVVFGQTGTTAIDLSGIAAGSGGFVINGQSASDSSGISVASAGDVNGDGLADLIVGASSSDPAAGLSAGRSYVVFGQTGTTAINLSAIEAGSGGFVINGQCAGDGSGKSVASAGDVNGDGLADLIVGAPSSDPAAGSGAGRSYVVFGQIGTRAVDLSAASAGTAGFVINGQCAGDLSGISVSSAGDVNGDGLADLIVGAPNSDPAAVSQAGRSYVVFGQTGTSAVDLSVIANGVGGFVINGRCAVDISGSCVASAGDVNGDGLADLIVGASYSSPTAASHAGRSYVVFGQTGTSAIDLFAIANGVGGFVINGQCANDWSGKSVASAGDVNGDGLADLIVGVYRSDPAASLDAGRSYVVFGQTSSSAIDLSAVAVGQGGFVINGQCAYDGSGISAARAGDVNGDGLADLIVGAYRSDPAAGSYAGRNYVIFGSSTGAFNQTAVDQMSGSGNDTLTGTAASETIVAGAGNDTVTGNGGADVLYGGAGSDTFIVNSGNIAALGTGVTNGNYARIDGGSGLDTISLAGSGVTLNLTTVANQGGASPSSASRIESIERIDLTGSGNNTLTLSVKDVLDMAGMNSFNNANGWAGLGTIVQKHQLIVDGNAGDVVTVNGSWTNAGSTMTNNGHTYVVYNANTAAAQMLIDTAVTGNIPQGLPVELSAIAAGTGGFVINGQCANDWSGRSVASAGDVNGDGLADLIVGASNSDPAAGSNAGRSYVVFGQTGTSAINLSAIAAGTSGFVITGQCAGDHSGWNVASAGDVNGDGLADLIVGAPYGAGDFAGRSYVVFGQTGTSVINLSAITNGAGGFVIDGHCANDVSGSSVASAGDVNGDGLADLIIGADRSDPAAGSNAGRSYVIFGQTGTSAINLSAIAAGTGGFVINGQCASDYSGWSVDSAGDVNGDGLSDLIVGAPLSAPAAGSYAGRSYVVFGQTGTSVINLSAIANGSGGFVINGQCASNQSGHSVASAGDVNGDGLSDLIIGAFVSDSAAGSYAGRSYVVFGQTGTSVINLSAITNGSGGFVINGQCAYDRSGSSVSSAGDVNGDGLSDLIVGAPLSEPAAGSYAGRSYVVFGQSGTTAINLSAIANGVGGFVIDGHCANDSSGISVASAGDVNGDGLADLIIGAYQSDPAAGSDAGRSYVIFGSTTGAFNQTAVDQISGSGNDTLSGTALAETIVAGAGNDTVTGNGGADVLYGGAGNDTFIVNSGNIAALGTGVTNGNYARIDGGSGVDTIAIVGAGVTANFDLIANQGGASPSSASRIESIERIDLTGSGNNTLTLSVKDVIDMASMNSFNNANGWADGTYNLAAGGANGVNPEQRHQLVVDGNAGDTVTLTEAVNWSNAGTVTQGGNTYSVFKNNTIAAQMLIDTDISFTLPKTGAALVQEALQHLGQDYSYAVTPGQSAYANASYAGPWDCSEFVSWVVDKVYDEQIGLREWNAYTGYWTEDSALGTQLHDVSMTDARDTPGAILFRFDNGLHHIAISEGNGKLIEANVNFHGGYYWSDDGTAYAPLANGNPPTGVDIGDVRETTFDLNVYSATVGWQAVEINDVTYTTTPVVIPPPAPGADDYAATTATTGVLSLAAPATGNIELAGDKDWFKIDNLVSGQSYQILVEGNGATPLSDTFFSLRNATGGVVIGSSSRNGGQAYDDAGPGRDAMVQFTASVSSTHYVAVGGGGANFADLTGGYRVALTEVAEPDDSGALATAIAINAAPMSGFVGYGGDGSDYYSFVAPSDGKATVHLTGVDAHADIDATLLNSTEGNAVIASGDNPTGNVIAGQTYFIKVAPHTAYGFADQSPYSIDLDFAAVAVVDPTDSDPSEALLGESTLATLAKFSRAAYHLRLDEPHTDTLITPHAYRNDPRESATTAYGQLDQGWIFLSDTDLSALAFSDGVGSLDWSTGLKGGIYTNQNAAALVARNGNTLVIAFRGTNDAAKLDGNGDTSEWGPSGGIFDATPDRNDWDNKSSHFDLLQPLASALDTYIASQGISQVFVTGHSLGAGMVDRYMIDHPPTEGVTFEAVTFASPGYSLNPGLNDSRIANFWIDGDAIKDASWLANNLGDLNNLHIGFHQSDGSNIDLDGGDIHSMDLYLEVFQYLNENGIDRGSLSPFGGALNDADDVYLDVLVTKDANGNVTGFTAGHSDNFLMGGAKGDVLIGGAGNDILVGDAGNDLLLGGENDDTYRFFVGRADVVIFGNDFIVDTGGKDSIEILGSGIAGIGVKDLYAVEKDGDVTITISASFKTSATITIKDYYSPEHKIEDIYLGSVRTTVDDVLAGHFLADPSLPQMVANAGAVAAKVVADAAVVTANASVAAAHLVADTAEATAQAAAYAALAAAQAVADAAVVAAQIATNATQVAGTLLANGIKNVAIKATLGAGATLEWIGAHTRSHLGEAFTPPDEDSVIGTVQSISGFVHVVGTDGDDEIIGDSNGNSLTGGAGNDLVQGGGGDDFIVGGSDEGNDTYVGGDGIDTAVYSSATQGFVVNLAAVIDQATGPEIGVDQISGIENVIGGAGDDTISGNGDANALSGEGGNDFLLGGWGDDALDGYLGNDMLFGGDGNDRLDGGADGDLLDGGRGADHMEGGSGNDLYVVDNRFDQITELTDSGIDSVSARVSHTLADNVENLFLTGSITVRSGGFFSRKTTTFDLNSDGTGNASDNLLRGNRGHNELDGLGGNDTLLGGAGADILSGGTGADRLLGGAGTDSFVFAAGDGGSTLAAADVLYDFEDGIDQIGLTGGLAFDNLTFTQGNGMDTATSNTVIGTSSGEYLVVLLHTSASAITALDFQMLGV